MFISDIGREILADILINFCYFGCYLDGDDKVQIGQHNVGVAILSRLGIFTTQTEWIDIINALCSVSPKTLTEEEIQTQKDILKKGL